MWYKRHLHHFGRHLLAPDVDFKLHAGLGALLRQIRRSDRRIDRGRHGTAAHDVHLPAIEKHRIAVARDGLGLRDLEADEPASDALELLALQDFEAGERRTLVELHDEVETRFVRRRAVVDVVAIERQAGLETQRVAGAEAHGLGATRADQSVPELLSVIRAAVQLETVFACIAGARDEALHAGHFALRKV